MLLVEDDQDSLDVLRFVLEDAGARVIAGRSAFEALDAPVDSFDMIISDIGMPDMDGYPFAMSASKSSRG